MQESVIYLELLENHPHFGYQKPILEWINKSYRHITTLDIDSASDKMLIDYACRLVTESDKCVLFIVANSSNGFGAAAPVIELVLQQPSDTLLLLLGDHKQLKQIFTARPQFPFFYSENEADLRILIQKYLNGEPVKPVL